MKKLFIMAGASLLVSLTGCNSENNSGSYTQKFGTAPINLITSVVDGTTTVSKGTYMFDLTISGQTGTISTNDLTVNNSSVSFKTPELKYASSGYDAIFKNVEATATGNMTYNLVNGTFIATPFYFYPGQIGINSPYNPPTGFNLPDILVASYTLAGMCVVKTFQQNTFFTGETTTTYPYMGEIAHYSTKDIMYGLILDLSNNTATLIMYKAKFSGVPQEPVKTQINLNNLPVDFSNGMIRIKAEDVIPDVVEGGQTTPNEDYIFNNIEFATTSEDLTSARITYTVAGRYTGTFMGSYVDVSYIK